MPNFVDDLTTLNYPKEALRAAPAGSVSKYLRAADWNTLCQAIIDTRGAVINLRNVYIGDTAGLVPASDGADETTKFLRKDGTYAVPGGGALSGAKVYNAAGVSIASHASTETVITFPTEEFDTGSYHDTVTNNSRLVAPVTGYYDFGARGYWSSNGPGVYFMDIAIRKNANATSGGGTQIAFARAPQAALTLTSQVTGIVFLTAGDYIEVFGRQNGGIAESFVFDAPTSGNAFWLIFRGV